MPLQVATSGEAVGGSRYRTLGRLGSGGMADVDLALQTGVAGSSRLCVLKRVRKDLVGRAEFVSMFFEEARISASLSHPNIVQIYEVGGDEQDCFLAMEFLRGRSYAHLQQQSTGDLLDYRVDLEVMLATLSGLEHAHQRKDLGGQPMCLVHRDISPPNVVVTYDGEIKLLDFGVAKSKDSLVKTEAGILKGKVAYMAPEVVAGDPFDARADLYAVGVMLWEATAARDRWPRMNDVAILAQLARGGPVENPGAVARGLPARADAICIKALAEDPNDRYQTAAQLRDDLLELCELLGGRLGQAAIKDFMLRRFRSDRAREELEVDTALQAQGVTPGATRAPETEVGGFTKRVRRQSERPPVADAGVEVEAGPPSTASGRGYRLWFALAAGLLAVAVTAKLLTPPGRQSAGSSEVGAEKSSPAAAPSVPQPLPDTQPPAETSAVDAPPSAAAGAKTKHGARPVKTSKVEARPATPSSGAEKPAPARGLELDRQDPWK